MISKLELNNLRSHPGLQFSSILFYPKKERGYFIICELPLEIVALERYYYEGDIAFFKNQEKGHHINI